ncbi:MAG: YggT family protein [Candidatus Auribacterota bacterium]|jgi:YggT family protein|nr:YggT family protein [Candidatus Auribacterota bacterium]
MLLIKLLNLYQLILLARVLISWVSPDPYNPIVRFLYSVTDPILVPLRRIIPPLGGMIDLSPMIAMLLIQLIIQLLVY